ncbi:MAG: hypothetical protein ACR2QW_04825 [bacterium]
MAVLNQLDLSEENRLEGIGAETYDRVANSIRKEFADFIGSLASSSKSAQLDWWLEAPATRNHVFSRLYHQLVALVVLDDLLSRGEKPISVFVDSLEMASIASEIVRSHGIKVEISYPELVPRLISKMRSLLSPYRSMIRLLSEWILIRKTNGFARSEVDPAEPLILIDTFAIPGFVKSDRYYPGLYENAGETKSSIRFVPQFFNLRLSELIGASKLLRVHPNKYLLKEDFLRFRDMLWCFGHLFRINKYKLTTSKFRGMEVSSLINADIRRRAGFRCAVRGLMNYRFACSLKRYGVPIHKIIDWFENHPLDRGWNAGFNDFFPSTKRVGYTGFYPAGQSYRPTEYEYKAGVLPPKHLLLGEGFNEDLCEFFPDCSVETAPAFRYQHLPDLNQRAPRSDSVLVAMPYYANMCRLVLKIVHQLQTEHAGWRFILKPHPAQPIDCFQEFGEVIAGNAEMTEKSISVWLSTCPAMITGAQASTILEAAASAVPTVVIVESMTSEKVSIPRVIPEQMYKICSEAPEADKALSEIMKSSGTVEPALLEVARELRHRCFSPVTSQTVDHMLLS